MADTFRPVFDAMHETAAAFVEASEANARAGRALQKMLDAAMHAREEHEDLRVTVGRLETLVIAQGNDLRALRERLDRDGR
jgi:hypothetical protein